MIYIYSGALGAGKTTMTVSEVKARADKENRQVFYYYAKIKKDVLPDWTELTDEDFKNWKDLPPRSIILIDEAWLIPGFTRFEKGEPPQHIKDFALSRQLGLDIYMIYQDPATQMNPLFKGFISGHVHFENKFGTDFVDRFEWQKYQGSVRSTTARAEAIASVTKLDKEAWQYFDSAIVHTKVKKIPPKLITALVILALCVCGAIYGIYNGIKGGYESVTGENREITQSTESPVQGVNASALRSSNSSGGSRSSDERLSHADLESYKPRVDSYAWTAPRYDELRRPQSYPRPAACIVYPSGQCSCFTQQATQLDVPDSFCRQTVKKGYFDDTLPDRTEDDRSYSRQSRSRERSDSFSL